MRSITLHARSRFRAGHDRRDCRRALASPVIRWTAFAWFAAGLGALLLGGDQLPFDRPSLADQTTATQVIASQFALLELGLLSVVVWLLTRHRALPDLAARAPARPVAWRETLLLLGYGAIGQAGGYALGHALGWHALSFHLAGTLYGTDSTVHQGEAVTWAVYNLVVYAVVPWLVFRRRYSAERLNLRSANRANDLLVIVVVLALESFFELVVAGMDGLFHLDARQLALGVPLTFALYFAGTVLPTMFFIYSILSSRYLALTGSLPATIVLGGVTYALLHVLDSWTLWSSPRLAALSLLFVGFQYFGPGMFKMWLTLRTGNAWVHVWAYHAVAPHVIGDTPLIVKVFRVR